METIGNTGSIIYYTYDKYTTTYRHSEIQALELSYVWKENNYYTYDNSTTQQNKTSVYFLKVNIRKLFTYINSNYTIFFFLLFLRGDIHKRR